MRMNKVLKQFCLAIYYLFGRKLPLSYQYGYLGKVSKLLRAKLCEQIFEACGKHINVEQGVFFGNGAKVQIGDYSGIGIDCQIPNSIIIGMYVMMGPEVMIFGQNHRFSDTSKPMMLQGYQEPSTIIIEDDVWIGARVIILPGVCIGKGSIIGAGAVVTSNISPYSICAGNPARIIRNRIKNEVVDD